MEDHNNLRNDLWETNLSPIFLLSPVHHLVLLLNNCILQANYLREQVMLTTILNRIPLKSIMAKRNITRMMIHMKSSNSRWMRVTMEVKKRNMTMKKVKMKNWKKKKENK